MDEIQKTADRIGSYSGKPFTIMEVCGTHTMNIARYGIRQLLPKEVKLLSGPGCPVCVTPDEFFYKAFALGRRRDVILTSFGDLLRVPVGGTTLLKQKSLDADIRIIYSPLDALEIARNNPDKKVVFLSVGFETTSPLAALAIHTAGEQGTDNFFLLCGNKSMIPAVTALLSDIETTIDGFLLPGNVSVVIGETPFRQVFSGSGIKSAICGFEPLHILKGIEYLLFAKQGGVQNLYKSFVLPNGNEKAQQMMHKIFVSCDSTWRGLGTIPLSGLCLREAYSRFDAQQLMDELLDMPDTKNGCLCGEVLKGKIVAIDCPLFHNKCTPLSPVGPCMVSSEGACAAYFTESE